MNPYSHFVSEYARFAREGRAYPLGGFDDLPRPDVPAGAPRVLLFSPHPDDEVVVGGLALRLLRECAWRVVNVAVTQGSNPARQTARYQELERCCRCVGFELVATGPSGLTRIHPRARQEDAKHWQTSVEVIARILREFAPRVIFFPHAQDWNSTHIGTHHLVVDALREVSGLDLFTVETEFWGAMDDPNLMIELSPQHVADLITALTFHVGEVQRNPYQLSQPAWMIDNVRRGAELVGGQGQGAPDFVFATLYRLRRWRNGNFEPVLTRGRLLSCAENPAELFGA